MPMLIALALLPTLSFYFYMLAQFWRQASRRRHNGTRISAVPPRAVLARAVVATYLENHRVAALPSGAGRLTANRAAKG
jgi:hypothetical protein